MKILYIAYGGEEYYIQTFCSIVSFCRWMPERIHDCVLYTDNPGFFATLPIEVRPYTFLPDTQGGLHMMGFSRFSIMQQALQAFGTAVLCVDSDTLWLDSLPFADIAHGTSYFHMFEAKLQNYNNQYFAPLYPYTHDDYGALHYVKVYNASTVSCTPEQSDLLQEAYTLSCLFYKQTGQWTADQIALGYIFGATTKIHTTYESIFHYRAYKGATLHKLYQLLGGTPEYTIAHAHMPSLLEKISLGSMQFHGKTGDLLKDYYIEKPEKLQGLLNL